MVKRVLLDRLQVSRARFPVMFVEEAMRVEGFDLEAGEIRTYQAPWLGPDVIVIEHDDGKA